MSNEVQYKPEESFSRNQGWLSMSELHLLRTKTVAIAGVGGVGGHYAEALARMGFSRFHLADFDRFESANFNRQNGSGISTLGRKKLDVIAERILDINPEAEIVRFENGAREENIVQFLQNVDIYLDGLDFFCLRERILIFQHLRQNNIPGITVAPVGMGAAAVVFTKDSMSFEDYFGMSLSKSNEENSIHFLAGLTPSAIQRSYVADISRMDLAERKVSSTPMGCYLSAGVAVSIAVKILTGRGEVLSAPHNLHFDAFLNTYKNKYVWIGHRNPLVMVVRAFIRMAIGRKRNQNSIFRNLVQFLFATN